jgi:chemotaxis signal transduction protein
MSRELVLGVHKLPEKLLLILDPKQLIKGIAFSGKPALLSV